MAPLARLCCAGASSSEGRWWAGCAGTGRPTHLATKSCSLPTPSTSRMADSLGAGGGCAASTRLRCLMTPCGRQGGGGGQQPHPVSPGAAKDWPQRPSVPWLLVLPARAPHPDILQTGQLGQVDAGRQHPRGVDQVVRAQLVHDGLAQLLHAAVGPRRLGVGLAGAGVCGGRRGGDGALMMRRGAGARALRAFCCLAPAPAGPLPAAHQSAGATTTGAAARWRSAGRGSACGPPPQTARPATAGRPRRVRCAAALRQSEE